MRGALLPLASVPSWCAEGQLYHPHMTSAFSQAVLMLQTYGFVILVFIYILITQMTKYRLFNVVVINYIITFHYNLAFFIVIYFIWIIHTPDILERGPAIIKIP
jgi:hypothetical protein